MERIVEAVTVEEVSEALKMMKQLIRDGKYQLSLNRNRLENKKFLYDFDLMVVDVKELLLALTLENFSEKVADYKNPLEKHFIFGKLCRLVHREEGEMDIEVYFKYTFKNDGQRVVVISFHQANRPITYHFVV